MIAEIKDQRDHPPAPVEISFTAAPVDPNAAAGAIPFAARTVLQRMQQEKQLAEVEAEPEPGSVCDSCPEPARATTTSSGSGHPLPHSPYLLRSSVNEFVVFFAAIDHGRAVSDLRRKMW